MRATWIGAIAALAAGCGASGQPSGSAQGTTAHSASTPSATTHSATTQSAGTPSAGTPSAGAPSATKHTGAIVTPGGQHLSKLSTPGTPKGEQTVRIQVLATSARASRQALALVPVYIDNQGPFPFALDTGASRSLVAAALAQRLHLPDRGSAGMLQGVTGATAGENYGVATWRAGSIRLPPAMVAALGTGSGRGAPNQGATGQSERGPVGLLGSDVLSRYGKIAIDYDKGLLVLDPPVK